ncbi:alpha/beta-hydrolase, partial [Aureobasidium melanogenum]|uniref:Alpha/beta-hydrolase n=1 Tax=Aureobasidium melanogenum (strain CBS 110374) TaxID=1043003 RepID=A0A074W081_AURM1
MFGTTTNSKPTVIFVTGAWHKPHLYAGLLEDLRKISFPVVAPSLPSVGGTCENFDDDVHVVRKAIADEISQGHEIVMLMHSYGGLVGSEAVQGYSKQEVPRGGGVVKMIYMAAFALEVGRSLMDALNNKPLPWWQSANEKQWQATNSTYVFYNDVDPQMAETCVGQLDLQAKGSFESKQTYAAWKYIDSTFIVCSRDNAIPKEAQIAMANQPGGRFTIEYLDAGHSPFLSVPHQTVEMVRKTIWEPGTRS